MNLDNRTLAACVVALSSREKECRLMGYDPSHWERAKRQVKLAILQRAADEMNSDVPALLRRQAD